jgi:WD40 repeat protein
MVKKMISGGSRQFYVWDLQSGEKKYFGINWKNDVLAVSFNEDNSMVYTASDDNTIKLWDIESQKMIKKFKKHTKLISSFALSPDNKYLFSGAYIFQLLKSGSGEEIYTSSYSSSGGHKSPIISVCFSPNTQYIITGGSYGDNTIKVWLTETGKYLRTLNGHHGAVKSISVSPDNQLIASGSEDNTIKIWSLPDGKELRTLDGHSSSVNSVRYSSDGKYLLSGSSDGTVKIWSSKTGKCLLTIVKIMNSSDWIVYTPDGRFDGTENGIDLLYYVEDKSIIPLSSLYEKFYTPNLISIALDEKEIVETEIEIEDLNIPPEIKSISPNKDQDLEAFEIDESNILKSKKESIEIVYEVDSKGDSIDEIRLYQNGKLIITKQRGYTIVKENSQKNEFRIQVQLTKGQNTFKAVAINSQRTESIPDELIISYDGINRVSDLYLIAVGLDQYKNETYNLNYAVADASAFSNAIQQGSKSIYGSIREYFIKDDQAVKENIINTFKEIKQEIKQEDVFMFYYAGHGIMSMGEHEEFYIVPHDITNIFGDDDILNTKGISASELKTWSVNFKAQKQLYVFDACQSGGINDVLVSRGPAEEKAIAQLARSTGTFWLMASGSDQYATEFSELGHGLFTYAILNGLQGDAEGSNSDKKITVKELGAYLDDIVPQLTEKYRGSAQYPRSFSFGMDFPIIIVE